MGCGASAEKEEAGGDGSVEALQGKLKVNPAFDEGGDQSGEVGDDGGAPPANGGCGPSKPSGDDGGAAYRDEEGMSAKVADAIATIKKQIVELQEDVDKHGAAPSPELLAVAARQAADAVGSTLCVIKSLEQQLAEANAKLDGYQDSFKDPILKPLERDLDAARATLKAAVQVCTNKWNLDIEEPFRPAVDNQATFASLPMTVPKEATGGSGATMIGVVGRLCLLQGESSVPAWMFAAFAQKRVAESTTLVKIILNDVQKYDAELARQLERPGGATAVAKLVELFPDRISLPDAILHQTIQSGGTVTEAWIKERAAAATPADVPLDSLAYVAHARLAAGPVSIMLYEVVSELLHAHDIEGSECLPGMVKGSARIVFKSMTKYLGNTSRCHDLARATVSVRTLADVVAVVLAVLACPLIVVIRSKNRLDPLYDAIPIGGYRDVQLQCLLQDSTDNWHYAELQINLVAMISIKEGGEDGGGHHAFDQARLSDSFSERTLRYNGSPSDVVFGMVSSGVLLALDLSNNKLDESQQTTLLGALKSNECRIRSLVLAYCKVGASFGEELAKLFATGHLQLTVLK